MAINAGAILEAIEQCVDGKIGTTRTVATAALGQSHTPWIGQVISQPRYDVQIVNMDRHVASPISAIANRRVDVLEIQIDLRHPLQANIQEDKRRDARALMWGDVDECIQALHFPGNLNQTSAGTNTGIMDGLLMNLGSELIEERWDTATNYIHSRIRGEAWVVITQAV